MQHFPIFLNLDGRRVVLVSVPEGPDKPAKYPKAFTSSQVFLITKTDLLPHLDFYVEQLVDNARRVNPGIAVIQVSATKGEGMERWLRWIGAARDMAAASA